MSERKRQKQPRSPEAKAGRRHRLAVVAGWLVVAAAAASAAVPNYGAHTRRTTADKPTPVTYAQPPRPKPERAAPEASPQEYLESGKRNDAIEAAATNAGKRIVAAAEDGKIGRFDFYNFKTNEWGRTGNPGWGALQHNPQYGGSPNEVAAFVYQGKDGQIDLSKGVQDVVVRIIDGKHPLVELRSPSDPEIGSNIDGPLRGWTTSVDGTQMAGPPNSDGYDTSRLRSIDHQAMAQLNQQLTQLGI